MTDVQFWISLIPAFGIAGSGVVYVINLWRDSAERRRAHFFELMQFIDSDRPLATKMAAAYQLRNFPEHKDFIIRFCNAARERITGAASGTLIAELDATKAYFETR